MAKILYVYNDQVYANITNKCDCNCTFCIRKQFDGVGCGYPLAQSRAFFK